MRAGWARSLARASTTMESKRICLTKAEFCYCSLLLPSCPSLASLLRCSSRSLLVLPRRDPAAGYPNRQLRRKYRDPNASQWICHNCSDSRASPNKIRLLSMLLLPVASLRVLSTNIAGSALISISFGGLVGKKDEVVAASQQE